MSSSGTPQCKRQGGPGGGPAQDHKDDAGSGASYESVREKSWACSVWRNDCEGISLVNINTAKTSAKRLMPAFSVVPSDGVRSNGQELKHKKFNLDMRNIFTLREAEHWNRLPREIVESPILETFKTHLDKFLCNLF